VGIDRPGELEDVVDAVSRISCHRRPCLMAS
jgi:hypothetical protein